MSAQAGYVRRWPVYGDDQTGPMFKADDVAEDMKTEAQSRIDRHSVSESFERVKQGDATLFVCDNEQAFLIIMPHEISLHIDMAFSRIAGLFERQFGYWKDTAKSTGFSYLQCFPGNSAMERYLRMQGFAKSDDSDNWKIEV